jgi:polyhydroxyalkanoate synthesis regulator phasin
MRLTSRTTVAAAGAALALAAGVGGALAAGSSGGPSPSGPNPGGPHRGGPPGSASVATYLGLTADELRTQLRSGKTLAQIAAAQGKTVAGLQATMLADAKTHLDQAVADGKLTAAEAATRLADLKSHLDEIVNQTGPPRGGPGHAGKGPGGHHFGSAAASYLGLTEEALRTQIESGKSLAQVAAAQGKSVAGLEAAILADAKTHLDQAVADGKLTADQAKTMLEELSSRLDDIVNRTGPPGRP